MRKIVRWASVVVCMSFFALALPVWAEEDDVPLDKLPKAVVEAVKAKFKGGELVSATSEKDDEGKTTYEVTLKYKGHNTDVSLTAEGKITGIEREMDAKDLPKDVSRTLDDKFAKATFKRVEEVTQGEKVSYEVLLVTTDKKTIEVVLDPKGKIVTEVDKTKKK